MPNIGFWATAGGAGGAAGAYELISTTLVTSGVTSVTFTSGGVWSTYKHLQLRMTARTNRSDSVTEQMQLRFNSDSGANYWYHRLFGQGTTVSSASAGAYDNSMEIGQITGNTAIANSFGVVVADILDFGSSSKTKTVRTLTGRNEISSNTRIQLTSGFWNSTLAATSITLIVSSGNSFLAGSRFSLYGIKG